MGLFLYTVIHWNASNDRLEAKRKGGLSVDFADNPYKEQSNGTLKMMMTVVDADGNTLWAHQKLRLTDE